MKRITLPRALALAGLMAVGGVASAASMHGDARTETWYFPDGSSHVVQVTPAMELARDTSAPDTTTLGAGPSLMDDGSQRSTQTWFFPDGYSVTVEQTPGSEPTLLDY